jgi:hypothetical protein
MAGEDQRDELARYLQDLLDRRDHPPLLTSQGAREVTLEGTTCVHVDHELLSTSSRKVSMYLEAGALELLVTCGGCWLVRAHSARLDPPERKPEALGAVILNWDTTASVPPLRNDKARYSPPGSRDRRRGLGQPIGDRDLGHVHVGHHAAAAAPDTTSRPSRPFATTSNRTVRTPDTPALRERVEDANHAADAVEQRYARTQTIVGGVSQHVTQRRPVVDDVAAVSTPLSGPPSSQTCSAC